MPSRNRRHTETSFQHEQETHWAPFPAGYRRHTGHHSQPKLETHWTYSPGTGETRVRLRARNTQNSFPSRCSTGYWVQLPAGTVDILSTVPSRNRRRTVHCTLPSRNRNTLGTAPIRNSRNALGIGTVPNRNKKYTGARHSSQPEQEMQWVQFPAKIGGTLGADPRRNNGYMGHSSQQEQGTSGENMMTIVTRRNMEHLGRISSLKINLIS